MPKHRRHQKYLGISEAAQLTGLTQRTLRFYEEKGLFLPPTRLESGFRLYSEEDIRRVRLVCQLQDMLGFSLADIRGMVEAEEITASLTTAFVDTPPAQLLDKIREAIKVTELQLNAINEKISRLNQMRLEWQQKVERYRQEQETLEAEPGYVVMDMASPIYGTRGGSLSS